MGKDKTDFNLEQAIGFNLNRAAYLMSETVAARFREQAFQLTAQDFGILYRVWKQDGLSQVELAALMLRDKTTITRRLDGLVKKGLIERRMSAEDRRVFLIHLTAAGRKAMAKLTAIVSDFQQEVLSEIPERDKASTLRTLKRISEKLLRNET